MRSGRPKAQLDIDIGGKPDAIDSSVIDLTRSMFDLPLFRRSKGGILLHPMPGHDVYLPVWANITEAKIHDRKIL
ncbi:MAG: hypothetical protein LBL95_10095 [Deltaproteobacteria bacterium]|nr:hypothetical protein [Deltaproteobacteria bacterium]